VPAVLGGDAACQWRDVAAAPTAPAATTALAGVAAKMGRGSREGIRGWECPTGFVLLAGGPRWPREDERAVQDDANSSQI
jgi:hypothetical protein